MPLLFRLVRVGEGVTGIVDVECDPRQVFQRAADPVQQVRRHVMIVIAGMEDGWTGNVRSLFQKTMNLRAVIDDRRIWI